MTGASGYAACMTIGHRRPGLVRISDQSDRALGELAAFVAVVDSQGFTAAARAIKARKATLSERVQSLEARLGVALLVRTTRAMRLTEEGRVYLDHARRALAAWRDAESAVNAAKTKPQGVLRVTTSAAIAGTLLETVVTEYLARCPDVVFDMDTSVRRIDIAREGFDLAIRTGPLEESSLVARRLGSTRCGYYASPGYLKKHGTPKRPEQLAEHDLIIIPKSEPMDWPFVVRGRVRRIAVRPRLSVTSFELAARAATAGVGILRCPAYFVDPYVSAKQLSPVLEAWTPPSLDVYAVYPPAGGLVPKTRIFIDLLAAWFNQRD